ncbi:MAG: leucine-rich repeat protein [Clostridia bacterium]|nr:leucine-rich repeat protein [Clostridia bacterium]
MKKVRKVLILFVIIIGMIFIRANIANAADSVVASGDCGESITWSLNNTGILTISGSGSMTNGKESPWSEYQDKVKSVVFDGTITTIGNYSFKDNQNIKEIEIPTTIQTIGSYAFYNCTNLKEINIPSSLYRINNYAFYGCASLENIDLGSNIMYINEGAFANCSSLKTIKITSDHYIINEADTTISNSATIYGYNYSNAFYYARYNGRKFHDIATGKETTETITMKSYLDALPTTNVKALGTTAHHGRSYSGHTFNGYTSELCNEKDITNETYIKIKKKVDEITAECTTNEEKAKAITRWVYLNVTYVSSTYGSARIGTVYYYFNSLKGNCEIYTLLTNYMLYLCDIPTATATSSTHMWSIAFIDGKWVYIDATGGMYGVASKRTNQITFAYDGLVYAIDDPTVGAYVTGIAKNDDDLKKLTSFTIPANSYMKGIYPSSFKGDYELKATKGTMGEEYIRKNRTCIKETSNQIIGNNDHKEYETITEIITAPTYYSQGKCYEIKRCKACGYEYSRTIKMMDRLVGNTNGNTNNSGVNNSENNNNTNVTITYTNNTDSNTNGTNNIIKVNKVSGVTNKTQDQKSITIKWDKISDVTGYELEKYDTSKNKYIKVKELTGTSCKVTGLKVATTYKFRVRAYKIIDGRKYYGNYSDVIKLTTKTKTPTISKLKAGKKKATVKYKKVSGAYGYQIQYSTNKKFKKGNKSSNTTKLSKTVKKLKSKKKYYVRIRTYRTVNGKKIYSNWSKVKNIKVK